jgi:glycerol kinase
MDRIPKVKHAVENERAMFGTVDTWLIWVCVIAYNRRGEKMIKLAK